MFARVIAGVDGFEGGRDAAELGTALCSGRLTLVGAYPVDPVRSRGLVPAYERLVRDDLDAALEAARAAAGADAELLTIPDTSPAHALHRVAEDLDAELIVVGSSRHGRLGRLLLGDVSRGVLHHAPCPVAVASRGYRGAPPRTIGVGFDGSPEARAALDLASGFAGDRDAALSVFVAWEDPPMPVAELAAADVRDLREERSRWADQQLAGALAKLPSAAGRVLHGRPDQVLAEAAATCDLLVVGSRGWGPARRIAAGSTSDRLIHEAQCPVLVVPRPAEPAIA
jgi:nucleotide-binding universal stress UspA family protein